MKCSGPNLTQGNQKKTSKTSLHYCESNWNVFLLLYLVFTTLNKANFMMVTLVKMQILRVTLIFIVILHTNQHQLKSQLPHQDERHYFKELQYSSKTAGISFYNSFCYVVSYCNLRS